MYNIVVTTTNVQTNKSTRKQNRILQGQASLSQESILRHEKSMAQCILQVSAKQLPYKIQYLKNKMHY